MKIEVHLFANLARYLPAGAGTVELPDGVTVADLVRHLAIPDDLPRLTLVNGQDAPPDRRLAAGDVVHVFPPLAGGEGPAAPPTEAPAGSETSSPTRSSSSARSARRSGSRAPRSSSSS